VKFEGSTHRFSVIVDCPFTPDRDFMFVFRDNSGKRDDCALIVDHIDGWDATNGFLLVSTKEWNMDDWLNVSDVTFADAKAQLLDVVGCEHRPPI
jgi:hypothetical protein